MSEQTYISGKYGFWTLSMPFLSMRLPRTPLVSTEGVGFVFDLVIGAIIAGSSAGWVPKAGSGDENASGCNSFGEREEVGGV